MSDEVEASHAAFARRTRALFSVAGVACAFALLGALIGAWGWTGAFRRLGVPTLSPPLADMRTLQGALLSEARGLDPRVDNPGDPWRRSLDYPEVWLRIARSLDLGDERNLRVFVAVGEIGFVAALLAVAALAPTLWLSLGAFSGATLLLLERGNNDAYLFGLVTLAGLVGSEVLAAALLLLSAWLKLYPLFAVGRLGRNRAVLGAFVVLAGAWLALHARELWGLRAAAELGVNGSYGAAALAARLRIAFGLELPPFVLSLAHLAAALGLAFAAGGRFAARPVDDRARRLLLVGGGIYVGSFLTAANWEYRLVFLLLCLPHFSRLKDRGAGLALALVTLAAANCIALERLFGVAGAVIGLAAKSLACIGVAALLLCELGARLRSRPGAACNRSSVVAS